ncbi:MAG: EutN/CcmL family microcompartment protein [Planctomycetaceae bacterium]|nr:EutN/CcmL family microcompartment protein [Planctomycetaceae bacterium]
MIIAKIIGSVVATQKAVSLVGQKLLVIEPYRLNSDRTGMISTSRTMVAVDTVGSGEAEFVLVVLGSAARLTPESNKLPTDATIVGIVDSIHIGNQKVTLGTN